MQLRPGLNCSKLPPGSADKIKQELGESEEMISVLWRYGQSDPALTDAEVEAAKDQMADLAKVDGACRSLSHSAPHTMRLELSRPPLESLNGKRESFSREWSR